MLVFLEHIDFQSAYIVNIHLKCAFLLNKGLEWLRDWTNPILDTESNDPPRMEKLQMDMKIGVSYKITLHLKMDP